MAREVRPNHTTPTVAPGRTAPAASRRNDRNNNPAFTYNSDIHIKPPGKQ